MGATPRKSGFLELGSTSIKFYVLDPSERGSTTRDEKVAWDLGYDVFGHGRISPRTVSHLLDTLRGWQERFPEIPFRTVTAVGTAALREAQNVEVLERVLAEELGLQIHIIEGGIEAFLLETGFRDRVTEFPTALFDLGGGSLEFIEYLTPASTRKTSVPVGAVRLHCAVRRARDLFEYIREARRVVARGLEENLPQARDYSTVIGTGGTVRAVAQCAGTDEITPEAVQALIDREVHGPVWEDLEAHRRKLFLPGLLAIEGLFSHAEIDRVIHRRASVKRGLISMTSMMTAGR